MIVTTIRLTDGVAHQIEVVFPFDYPDVEPTVCGPPLLTRHQNARDGNFCLMANPAVDWHPLRSAAELVDKNLRNLLEDSAAGPAVVAGGEADMPEPLSMHISPTSRDVVLVPDPFWRLELDRTGGDLVLRETYGSALVVVKQDNNSGNGKAIDSVEHSRASDIAAAWVSLSDGALKPWPTRKEVLDAALAADTDILRHIRKRLKRNKALHAEGWIGITFQEEGPQVGMIRRGWTFIEVQLQRDRPKRPRLIALRRAAAFTESERALRLPELRGIANATVVVVGAGSVGAPLVLELAKAGAGHITVVDPDAYDVNNATRHILAPYRAGRLKAAAVAVDAEALNPFVTVECSRLAIGAGGAEEAMKLDQIIARARVLVDATGSPIAARILARRCREHAVTMIVSGLTAGSYGADIATLPPEGPCYWCLQLGQADGSIPAPPVGPTSSTTPTGCATPAFSGAGFDATALAALTARRVVQAADITEYPPAAAPLTVLDFRGEPAEQHVDLPVHPSCPLCQPPSG
ncbi:MAG TPA: ThiF family adenylyltransferase [Conexibacter sp.]